MTGVDIMIVGLSHYGAEHLVQQNAKIHFVTSDWQGNLAFDAYHTETGKMVGRVAQADIARLDTLNTRCGVVTLNPNDNISQGCHSQIRRISHKSSHCAIVTLFE